MSDEIIEEFGIGKAFKNLGKKINDKIIKPINKAVIQPINKVIIKPAIEGIKEKIIEPIKDAIAPEEPEDVTYDEVTSKDLYLPEPKINTGVPIAAPPTASVKLTPVAFQTSDTINALNDPTIPSERKNTDITIEKYNTKTIEYLDTDIYYKSRKDQFSIKDKVPKSNKYIKYFVITILVILGILVCIEFSKSPKERWNILFIYILLIIFIKFFYNINKRFLFFNSVEGIDKIFDKNKRFKFLKLRK